MEFCFIILFEFLKKFYLIMICIMCNVLIRDNYDLNNGLLYFYFENYDI